MSELVRTGQIEPRWRKDIPEEWRSSIDTRLAWLWRQRFGTVQSIYQQTTDTLDRTACMLILQCIIEKDLSSIRILFERLAGGAVSDEELAEPLTELFI